MVCSVYDLLVVVYVACQRDYTSRCEECDVVCTGLVPMGQVPRGSLGGSHMGTIQLMVLGLWEVPPFQGHSKDYRVIIRY